MDPGCNDGEHCILRSIAETNEERSVRGGSLRCLGQGKEISPSISLHLDWTYSGPFTLRKGGKRP